MLEEELKEIWRGSSRADQVKFDLSKLLIELNATMKQVEKNIRARDRRETVASLIGIPIFGYFAYAIPFPVTKIACILAIAIFCYIIYKLRSVRKQMPVPNMSLSFREQLAHQKEYMIKQKKLLDQVLYWYVLPPYLMNIVFIFGLGDPEAYNWSSNLIAYLPIAFIEKIRIIIFLTIFYGWIVWLNRRAARKAFPPVIAEIERVQQQLVQA
jgi:hypothetical protein